MLFEELCTRHNTDKSSMAGLSNSGKYNTSVPNLRQVLLSNCDPPEIHFLVDFSLYSVNHSKIFAYLKKNTPRRTGDIYFFYSHQRIEAFVYVVVHQFLILKLLTLLLK